MAEIAMQPALAQLATAEGGAVALETLHKIVSNILANQDDPKYRKLRLENAAMQRKVFSVAGGIEFMLALGFNKTATDIILPASVSAVRLLQARQAIEDALKPKQTAAPAPAPVPASVPVAATAPPTAAPPVPAAAAPTAPAAAFSADSIASILNNIQPAASSAAASFSADSIASMLRNMPQQAQQPRPQQPAAEPLDLMDVLSLVNPWDQEMNSRLSGFLPEGSPSDSVAETLSTPQLQQAAASFTHALNGLGGQGLIAEMRLNPAGFGVEAFLRALQEKAEADKQTHTTEGGRGASSTSMDLS